MINPNKHQTKERVMSRKHTIIVLVGALIALLVLGVFSATSNNEAGATERDQGKHHPYETEGSCSLYAKAAEDDNGRAVVRFTYNPSPGDTQKRNVQVYEYTDESTPEDGHVGRSHRHKLVNNQMLAPHESFDFIPEMGKNYEIHYAGGWYHLQLLIDLGAECAPDPTTTTSVPPASSTTQTSVEPTTTVEPTTSTEAVPTTVPEDPTTTTAPEDPTTTLLAAQVSSTQADQARSLAHTGGNTGLLTLVGSLLVASGGILLLRRRALLAS